MTQPNKPESARELVARVRRFVVAFSPDEQEDLTALCDLVDELHEQTIELAGDNVTLQIKVKEQEQQIQKLVDVITERGE